MLLSNLIYLIVPTSKQMELITGMTSLQELCVTREDLSGWFDLPAGIERLKNLKTLKIEGLRGGLEHVAKLSGLLHLELTQYEYTQGEVAIWYTWTNTFNGCCSFSQASRPRSAISPSSRH